MATTSAAHPGHLTPREDQVLSLIGLGLTNREIGLRLGIAEKTVKNTVTVVLAKLGFQRRAQAAIYVTVRRITAAQAPAARADCGVRPSRRRPAPPGGVPHARIRADF